MRVAITGSSGLVGTALSESLRRDGHEVVPVVRSGDGGAGTIRWDIDRGELDPADLEGFDGVVHLAGAPIGAKRWTDEQKRAIDESRSKGTALLAGALAACSTPPPVLVSASGADFYGDTGDTAATEATPAGTGTTEGGRFIAGVAQRWEAATAPAEAAGIRVVHLRSSMVLDRSAGALATMVPIFKLGIGGRIGSGRQWMSWISLADEVRVIRFVLDGDLRGPVNSTSPTPVTNAEFTKALGRVLHRPTVLPVPSFAPMVLFGREMVEALVLSSHRILPARLQEAGFEFEHPDLEPALAAALQG